MPGFKAAKDRLTLLLGSNVEGDLKLKPLLVYRSENPRALKNYVKSTLPVIWKANPKALVTSILFEEWFTKHFIPEPFESFSSTDQPNIDEITTDIVHLANRLPNIAVTVDDIDDLLCSHSQELTDEDLIELEAQVQ
ncbi:unnamed protein product [Euphydryas editha]|uniref:DDE-1 domain-containing protein n=1 Tax=Euphydryas editha TaxID=104508 RepID=A0AAU9TD03_EUPED|nr:unnamed protein product [Euphydryas editha]